MDNVEQNYIADIAKKYHVEPHKLMDVLGIKYKGDQYHVNGKKFLSYYEAILEAESGAGGAQNCNGSREFAVAQKGGVDAIGLRVIYNVHFLMSVFYAHFLIALFAFLVTIPPENRPIKLVAIEIMLSLLLSLHLSAFVLWRHSNKLAVAISVVAGIFLVLGFPIGTLLGLPLIYFSLNYEHVNSHMVSS